MGFLNADGDITKFEGHQRGHVHAANRAGRYLLERPGLTLACIRGAIELAPASKAIPHRSRVRLCGIDPARVAISGSPEVWCAVSGDVRTTDEVMRIDARQLTLLCSEPSLSVGGIFEEWPSTKPQDKRKP